MQMDEYLETLWCMKEDGKKSITEMKQESGGALNSEIMGQLVAGDFVNISEDEAVITLTEKGEERARRIIRSHRLAERLLFDAMGMNMGMMNKNFENGACEFEHIVTDELVNSICIMLGHPKECPHGKPIPPGKCCRDSVTTIESSVLRLADMAIGQSAKIAYINAGEDQDLHRLNGLQIRPGITIKLHQTYPSYVVECEGANIALDEEIAKNICVWSRNVKDIPAGSKAIESVKKRSLWDMFMLKKQRNDESI